MFERYTERARRVLFFSRYEASQLGSSTIESEHLLLGLLREGKGPTAALFAHSNLALHDIREALESRLTFAEKIGTSVEIPFAEATKRILKFAAAEADGLRHGHIGTEHLLLGILCEEQSTAASVLREKGLRLDATREEVVRLPSQRTTPVPETPDFAALADKIANYFKTDRGLDARDPATVLKEIWNARGAADIAKIEQELSTIMGSTAAGPYLKVLSRSLRGLDS